MHTVDTEDTYVDSSTNSQLALGMCWVALRRCRINMLSFPTGYCAVQWAMWKRGGLTSRDRLYSSESYLLICFLLEIPSKNSPDKGQAVYHF